jgi:hypothetical protein
MSRQDRSRAVAAVRNRAETSQGRVIMALADLGSPAAKIHSSLEDLQLAWSNTLEHWHDENSARFEEECLVPLARTIKLSLDAIGRMNESMQKAEHAVE